MYSYIFDKETGGILLTPEHSKMSKEPRPVYYKELDLLGFDNYFDYEKNDEKPYMIAEMTNYYYRGVHVASTKGGNIYEAPTLIITEEGKEIKDKLKFIDINLMVKKNDDILEPFINETIKKVYNTYIKYKNKVDVFYVAFSGGKDSIVCLDIVKRALPYNEFKVLFGDTGMEFPDTYVVVDKVEKECKELGIEFYRASSHLKPSESWDIFGPPANDIRWCCSVHKSAPQINLLRKIANKRHFNGFAFIGARSDESEKRSKYKYVSYEEKHIGQYNCYPILVFSSAEIFLYIYKFNLNFNNSYKIGNSRAGCLLCPFSTEHHEYVRLKSYKNNVSELLDKIKNQYSEKYNDGKLIDFIKHKGWKLRRSSRDIKLKPNYVEKDVKKDTIIEITNSKNDLGEWIKTFGIIEYEQNNIAMITSWDNKFKLELTIVKNDNNYSIKYANKLDLEFKAYNKKLKNIFRKTAMCISCGVCASNCEYGAIESVDNRIIIDSKLCIHCMKCNDDIQSGCLIYNSLKEVKGDGKVSNIKSLNRYNTHGPLLKWFEDLKKYDNLDTFLNNTELGIKQKSNFIKFLRDCQVVNVKNIELKLYKAFKDYDLTDLLLWGILYINCVYNSEPVKWFINNYKYNSLTTKDSITNEIIYVTADTSKDNRVPKDAVRDLIRIFKLPFSNLGLATVICDDEKDNEISIVRCKWENPIPEVILFSLYKYAEHCGDYDEKTNACSNLFSEFTLSRLYDEELEQEGISPYKIFGVEKEDMKAIINGLSIKYPDYINCSFTFDLDNINLNKEMRSNNVLDMIMGE